MFSAGHNTLSVPVQISEFVFDNDLVKPFSIFLYLKLMAGDKVHDDDEVISQLKMDLKMSDPKNRTYRKHFQPLLDLNWIGYNQKSGIYHIRSFDYIRATNQFKQRRATMLCLKDIKQMQSYLVGVKINNIICNQIYHWEKLKRKRRTVTQRDVTNQSKSSFHSSQPAYYGICNRKLAELLNCKYTRASTLKKEAAENGYIEVGHRYLDIAVLDKSDYQLRARLAQSDPAVAKRCKFWRKKVNGKYVIKLVQQLHDEITPLMTYKKIISFSNLKVPFVYKKGAFITKPTPIPLAA